MTQIQLILYPITNNIKIAVVCWNDPRLWPLREKAVTHFCYFKTSAKFVRSPVSLIDVSQHRFAFAIYNTSGPERVSTEILLISLDSVVITSSGGPLLAVGHRIWGGIFPFQNILGRIIGQRGGA